MTAQPLLYLCARPQREAADAEYASFRTAAGVGTDELHRHDLVATPLPVDVVGAYRGVVVGGSPFNVTDSAPSPVQARVERDLERLAGHALDDGLPVLFTCYGIGIVTRMLGGVVGLDASERASAATIHVTADGAADPLLAGMPASFSALTAHKEGARITPPGAVLLATNDDCPVQMYRVGDTLWTTQFHPEPTTTDFAERMRVYRDGGYFRPEEYDELAGAVRSADVTWPRSILRSFADVTLPAADS